MGKSCSKHGNLDIDYDTVTSRSEPEGECLSQEHCFEVSSRKLEKRREETAGLQAHDTGVQGKEYFEDGTATDTIQLLKLDTIDPLYETQLVVDLPISDTECTDKKPNRDIDICPDIHTRGTQTSVPVAVVEQERPEDINVLVEEPKELSNKNSNQKEDTESFKSSVASGQDEWSYTLYDFEGRGSTKDKDLSHLMKSICTVVGQTVNNTDFKFDKENRALKVKLAIGHQSKETRVSQSKPKACKSSFSRMLFPPPESEEAARLSSYIEEKLSVHSQSREKRNKNKYSNRSSVESARLVSKGSPRRSRCHYSKNRKEKGDRNKRQFQRNKQISDEESSYLNLNNTANHSQHKGCGTEISKQVLATPHHLPKERSRLCGSERKQSETDCRLKRSCRKSANDRDNIQFALPKRQETYPGACSDTNEDVDDRSSTDSDRNVNVQEALSTSVVCESPRLNHRTFFPQAHIGSGNWRNENHVQLNDFSSSVTQSEYETLTTTETSVYSDRHSYVNRTWDQTLLPRFQNDRDNCSLIESMSSYGSVRWDKESLCSSKQDAKLCTTSDNDSRSLDCSELYSMHGCAEDVKPLEEANDLLEFNHQTSYDDEASNSHLLSSGENSSTFSDRTSSSGHLFPSRDEAPWPSTQDVVGHPEEIGRYTSTYRINKTSRISNAPCTSARHKKIKCPCHFRSSLLKQKQLQMSKTLSCKQENLEYQTQFTTPPSYTTSHTHSHTHSCYSRVESICNSSHSDTLPQPTKIQHVYRHEHHHYHHYVDCCM